MATYNIEEGGLRSEGGKTFMHVTFKAVDGRSITCDHEVESEDPVVIGRALQAAANEFEGRPVEVDVPPVIETGVDLQFVEPPAVAPIE